jgi:hypothetical protein
VLWAPAGTAWESIPDGTMQPPGLVIRLNPNAGTREARWPNQQARRNWLASHIVVDDPNSRSKSDASNAKTVGSDGAEIQQGGRRAEPDEGIVYEDVEA